MTISVFWRDKVDLCDRVLCDDFRDGMTGNGDTVIRRRGYYVTWLPGKLAKLLQLGSLHQQSSSVSRLQGTRNGEEMDCFDWARGRRAVFKSEIRGQSGCCKDAEAALFHDILFR